jgi:hypothetical protein
MKRSFAQVVLIAALLSCSLMLSGCLPFLLLNRSRNNSRATARIEETYKTDEIDETLASNEEDDEESVDEEDSSSISTLLNDFSLDDTAWKTDDNSYMVYENNEDFKYYESEDNDGSYFEGTYDIYKGEEAVDYVTEDLDSFGVTADELQRIFDPNGDYDVKNFVCLVFHNEACYVDHEIYPGKPSDRPYYGWLIEKDSNLYLDIVDMKSGSSTLFVQKES